MNLFPTQGMHLTQRGAEAGARGQRDISVPRPPARAFRRTPCPVRRAQEGFSLLEMMITVVILLSVMGGVISILAEHQQVYQRQQLKGNMYQSLRGATELMSQEIGQAGSASIPGLASSPAASQPAITAPVAANATAQSVGVTACSVNSLGVNVCPVDSMFVGEQLDIDVGTSEEVVTLKAVTAASNTINAIFTNPHAAGAVLKVLGSFPNGVLTPTASDAGQHLRLFGDINSDGTLVYVDYLCNTNAGTLTRSSTILTPATTAANVNPEVVLLPNLIANPGGTACFQYTTQNETVTINSVSTTFTFVTNVAVTLSVQTSQVDPQTGQAIQLTKSLLNVAPRNVLMGLEAATDSPPLTIFLQPTPPNLVPPLT